MNRDGLALPARAASIAVGAAGVVTGALLAPPAHAAECRSTPATKTTVRYASHPGWDATLTSLDLYRPANACHAPVVMWVHGGGYQTGDKANQIADKVKLFNDRGWILVSVNYRLTRPGQTPSAQYPDHFDDVAASVGWVRRSIAAHGGDPDRIALLGHSAGADIVSNVATNPAYLAKAGVTPPDLRCIGPLDTEGFDKIASNTGQLQWRLALGNLPTHQTATSATRLVRPGVPDTIGVFRGTPNRQSIELAFLDRVRAVGSRAVTIDARSLRHDQVNSRIGAPGDTVMTPPLMSFLTTCLADDPKPVAHTKAIVKVSAVHRSSKLRVNVNPDLGSGQRWRFTVAKKRHGTWRTKDRTYATKGHRETRTLQFGEGQYRVAVRAGHGRLGATSTSVRLSR